MDLVILPPRRCPPASIGDPMKLLPVVALSTCLTAVALQPQGAARCLRLSVRRSQ